MGSRGRVLIRSDWCPSRTRVRTQTGSEEGPARTPCPQAPAPCWERCPCCPSPTWAVTPSTPVQLQAPALHGPCSGRVTCSWDTRASEQRPSCNTKGWKCGEDSGNTGGSDSCGHHGNRLGGMQGASRQRPYCLTFRCGSALRALESHPRERRVASLLSGCRRGSRGTHLRSLL